LIEPQFKAGDEVFLRILKDESSETLIESTVLRVLNSGDVQIKFAVPNEDGETTDTVNQQDLTLVSEPIETIEFAAVSPDDAVLAHLKILFDPGDTVCLTGVHATKKTETGDAEVINIFRKLEDITEVAVTWMRSQNLDGSNRYVAMNSLLPGSVQRIKSNFGAARNVFMECDTNGEGVLAQVHAAVAAGTIPPPTTVLRSSPGKYQFAWRVDSSSFSGDKVEAVNEALVHAFGGDPACTDRLRVFRLPTFINHKYPELPVCEIVETHDIGRRYKYEDFRITIEESKATVVKPPADESKVASTISYFEQAAEEAQIHIKSFKKWGNQGFIYEISCPFLGSHTGRKDSGTVIMVHPSAAISFKCAHGHCAGRTWQKDVRPEMEKIAGHPLRFGDPVDNVTVGKTSQTPSAVSTIPAENQSWGEPQPFDNSLLPVQPFKLEFLPSSLQPWAKDVSERMSVPLDFAGICILCVLAGCVNRRAFVFPKQQDKEWKESISISGAVISASGKMKTPTWKAFINPMQEIECDWQREHKDRIGQYKSEQKRYEESEKLKKKTKDESEAGPLFVHGKSSGVAAPLEPAPCRRLVVNDATPEKLHDIMTNNPEGLFVYRDEMTGWVAELDQKGRESERGLFLTAMNGSDPYTLDRIGRGSLSAIVSASLFGGFQPEPLINFLCDTRNVHDGMIARFGLLVWPDDTLIPLIDRTVDMIAKARFRSTIRTLAELKSESICLHFSPEAQPRFNDWLASHVVKVNQETNAGKQSHLSKYKGLLPKLAGLLQLADIVASVPSVCGNQLIDLDHLNRAILLLSYLESHMNRIYGCVKSPEQKAVESLIQHVKAGDLKDGFSIRDVQRKGWENLTKIYIEDAIMTLEDLNWVRSMPKNGDAGRGRPSPRWEVNPSLVSSGGKS
jgi:hypothetical protein